MTPLRLIEDLLEKRIVNARRLVDLGVLARLDRAQRPIERFERIGLDADHADPGMSQQFVHAHPGNAFPARAPPGALEELGVGLGRGDEAIVVGLVDGRHVADRMRVRRPDDACPEWFFRHRSPRGTSLHFSTTRRSKHAIRPPGLRCACLPCSTYCSSTPARAKRLAPRPDGPLTHFASPRGEKCRQQPMVKPSLHSSGDASRLNCVAPRSNMSNMLPRRALSAGRLAALGATRAVFGATRDDSVLRRVSPWAARKPSSR